MTITIPVWMLWTLGGIATGLLLIFAAAVVMFAYMCFQMARATDMNQETIDEAVRIATRAALNGRPVERIIWIYPRQTTDDPKGSFAVEPYHIRTASETPPWEEGR